MYYPAAVSSCVQWPCYILKILFLHMTYTISGSYILPPPFTMLPEPLGEFHGAGKMAEWLKQLLCKLEDGNSDTHINASQVGMAAQLSFQVSENRDMESPTCRCTHIHMHLYLLIHPYLNAHTHNHIHIIKVLLTQRKIIIVYILEKSVTNPMNINALPEKTSKDSCCYFSKEQGPLWGYTDILPHRRICLLVEGNCTHF